MKYYFVLAAFLIILYAFLDFKKPLKPIYNVLIIEHDTLLKPTIPSIKNNDYLIVLNNSSFVFKDSHQNKNTLIVDVNDIMDREKLIMMSKEFIPQGTSVNYLMLD